MMFRKKTVVIDAYQWNGERPLPFPLVGNWDNNPMTPTKVSIETLEGHLNVSVGDWIITGIKGEHYPCKPDIFEVTYEKVI
jgi:hypothetical protein